MFPMEIQAQAVSFFSPQYSSDVHSTIQQSTVRYQQPADTGIMLCNTIDSQLSNDTDHKHSTTGSNMPLALNDPLRENLLLVGHIALGDLWSTDRNTLEPALKRLSDLCTEKKTADAANNRLAFQLIKGYAIIVEVMNHWRKDRKIQYLCCLVILNVTEGNPNHVGMGVIDAVVSAMKAFPTFFPVQLCGCGAIWSLCKSKRNAEHLVNELQGIETIMSAVQRYPKAKNLQVWARWCLQNIHQWDDFRKAFLDAWVRSTFDDALFQSRAIAGLS